ncbi:unnamed protein product [marine sediment metagenome]|uniref:Uncharacterized protein n=1 Tax=marine sediment metagenome TaxID=412755 RepID=X0YDP0_9ZZZZ
MMTNGINILSEKCSLGKYVKHYDKNFNHSSKLKEVFGVFNFKGCDYVNKHNIRIEFKESFRDYCSINLVRFACYKKDFIESDYIVFCYYIDKRNYIFLHKSKMILRKYKFNKPKCLAQPYLTTVRKNYVEKFSNLIDLKEYIDKLER